MAERKPRNRVTRLLLELHDIWNQDADQIWIALKREAVRELEPRYKSVYEYCERVRDEERRKSLKFVSTARFVSEDVALALGIKQNHASMVLAELVELGLMGREVTHDKSGRHFEYWVK